MVDNSDSSKDKSALNKSALNSEAEPRAFTVEPAADVSSMKDLELDDRWLVVPGGILIAGGCSGGGGGSSGTGDGSSGGSDGSATFSSIK